MTNLVILGSNIRQDANGRYSLGDCWQLSGKEAKNTPARWHDADKTQEFLSTLRGEPENGITPISVVKTGPNAGRGFWGNKEAVIHYAMWINPEFCLTVIRAFDAMVSGIGPLNVQPLSREQQLASAVLLSQDIIREKDEKIAVLTPKAEGFDRFANSSGRTILREVGKVLNIGSRRGIELLREKKWTFRSPGGKWHAYSAKVDAGLLDVKYVTYTNSAGDEVSTQQVYVTPKGMARLAFEMGRN